MFPCGSHVLVVMVECSFSRNMAQRKAAHTSPVTRQLIDVFVLGIYHFSWSKRQLVDKVYAS